MGREGPEGVPMAKRSAGRAAAASGAAQERPKAFTDAAFAHARAVVRRAPLGRNGALVPWGLSWLMSRPHTLALITHHPRLRRGLASGSSGRWMQRHVNDHYVRKATAHGFRSRAAFKLVELDEKLRLLRPGTR